MVKAKGPRGCAMRSSIVSRVCVVFWCFKDGGRGVVKNHHETFEFSFAGDCRVWGNRHWEIETRSRIGSEIWR